MPTDIIWMECKRCEKRYTRDGTGLRLDGRTGKFKPCIGWAPGLRAIMRDERCDSTDYRVYREMDVLAAPLGTWAVDLSRKRN